MVMLRKSVNCLLLSEVPDNDVRVFTLLSRGDESSIVRDGQTSDHVVVSRQEVLVVRILNVSDHDAAASDETVLAYPWVQVDRVDR